MARKKKSLIPGLSFSWKRALGITRAKQKIARATGIPTTAQGRARKFGFVGILRMLVGGSRRATPAAGTSPDDDGGGCAGCLLAMVVCGFCSIAICMGLGFTLMMIPDAERPQITPTRNKTDIAEPVPAEPVVLAPTVERLDTAAAAAEPIREPEPDPVPPPATSNLRTWQSAGGSFRVEAELLFYANGKVKLRKADGVEVFVEVDKLSEPDRSFIEEFKRSKR